MLALLAKRTEFMDTQTLVLFLLGFVLLISGAEWLVKGASRLAATSGVSPLVVGLTIVAFGTSAPELAVSVQAAYGGQVDIAVGNVVGSNICNILLILGIAALFAPLVVAQQLIRLDVPLLIAVSILMYVLSWDGHIGFTDGLVMSAGILAYIVFSVVNSRRESRQVQEEYAREYGSEVAISGSTAIVKYLLLIVIGLVLLVLGARWLVSGAVAVARAFEVSELIIGLTIVSIGTSMPEIAASVVSSLRGERDIAVGNAIGSNLFNILAVLGLTAVVSPTGLPVSEAALGFDIPVMIAVAVACLPIFFTGYRIDRWEGVLFVLYYIAYLSFLVLEAIQHRALATFTELMVFVLPLTSVTLAVLFWRAVQRQKPPA